MKVIACVDADPEIGPLGGASRILDPIGGVPVLRRTVDRLTACGRADAVFVLCRSGHADRIRPVLEGTRATLHVTDAPDVPDRTMLRRARKWARDAWRGGLFWTGAHDEEGRPAALAEAAGGAGADSVARVSASAALLDPGLFDRMIAHHLQYRENYFMTFAQVPVGLVGEIVRTDLVARMAETGRTAQEILRYDPKNPSIDRAKQDCHFDAGARLRERSGRWLADSRRGMAFVERMADLDPVAGAAAILDRLNADPSIEHFGGPRFASCEWVRDPARLPVPVEGEVVRVDPDRFAGIVETLAAWDDLCLTVRGWGDPLDHPEGAAMLSNAVGSLHGVCVVTPGPLDERKTAMLLDADPDIVEVPLPEGENDREDLVHFLAARGTRRTPFLVVSMEKTVETDAAQEGFVDRWLERGAWPVIRPHRDYAGRLPDRAPLRMLPAVRSSCLRIEQTLHINAEGRVPVCDVDFDFTETLGRLPEDSLDTIWGGERLDGLRKAHRAGRFDSFPLCADCHAWDFWS